MQIPQDLFDKWKSLKSIGDSKGIGDILQIPAEKMGVLIVRISRVFGASNINRSCPDALFKALRQFYEQKEKELYTSKCDTDAK